MFVALVMPLVRTMIAVQMAVLVMNEEEGEELVVTSNRNWVHILRFLKGWVHGLNVPQATTTPLS